MHGIFTGIVAQFAAANLLPQRLYFPDVSSLFPEKADRLGLYLMFFAAARATD
jgi:hypothetical protein